MTNPDMEELIARYFEGIATADDVARLDGAMVADRRVAAAFMQMAQIDAGLRILCQRTVTQEPSITKRLQAAERVAEAKSARYQSRRRRSLAPWWPIPVAVAASLVVLVTVWAWSMSAPTPERPTASGAVQQPATPSLSDATELSGTYQVPGGGTVAMTAGTKARSSGTLHDPMIVLETGTIDCQIAKREPGSSFRVQTPHGVITVVGTRFQVVVGQETGVSVAEGTVAIDTAGMRHLIEAGSSLLLATGRQPERFGPVTGVMNGRLSDWAMTSTHGRVEVLPVCGPTGGPVYRFSLSGRNEWVGRFIPDPGVDWSGMTGISVVFQGTGSGRSFLVEIIDNRSAKPLPGNDACERFIARVVDARPGWQEVRLPFTGFTRRAKQWPGAPDDGLTLTNMHGLDVINSNEAMELVVERIATYR